MFILFPSLFWKPTVAKSQTNVHVCAVSSEYQQSLGNIE